MVVLSAGITTKNGKPLLARQFVDMSRIRIEGLMAAFPKLMGTGNKQHTFIETESVRYVYQPIESLFLLLITNKASNIVEDLETLRLLSKLVPDVAGGASEDNVSNNCFELIFAFDEVITTGGHKESINLQQIKTNLEMDSHEERLHNMIQESKRVQAKEEMAKKAKELQAQQNIRGMQGIGSGSGGGGGGGGMGGGDGGYDAGGGAGMGGSFDPFAGGGGSSSSFSTSAVPQAAKPAAAAAKKGMKLGGGAKGKNVLDSLMAEEKLAPLAPLGSSNSQAASAAAVPDAIPQAAPAASHPVTLVLDEKLVCQLSREGALESLELKGTLAVTTISEHVNKCEVLLEVDESGFNFAANPKVNKQRYDEEKVIVLKDATKGFPVGRPASVLRWSLSTVDEAAMPLTINCWPEEEGGGTMNVNIEYSLCRAGMELHDIKIVVPLGTTSAPQIVSIDGSHQHLANEGELVWNIDMIDSSNGSGSLEFNIEQRDADAFFPIQAAFSSSNLFAAIRVLGVTASDTGNPVQFGSTARLSTDNYVVS